MMRAVETRGLRRLIAAERMLRKFLLACACGAVACSDATGTAESVVASLAVTPPASTITVGSELPLQVVVQDATGQTITGAQVFWSVRDPGIASVSLSGVVTGLATGATQVAASAGGKSAIAAITVQRVPVASVVVRPTSADVTTGNRVQFSATVYDASQIALTDRSITWSSSNEAVATVDSTGMATAVSPGVATITATSEVRSDAATITVTPAPVGTVAVAPSTATLFVQGTVPLSATITDASGNTLTGRTVTWTTSAPAVATVSSSGSVTSVVTGVAPGTATITATSEGKSGTATVTVTLVPVGTVTVEPSTATVESGSTTTLTAKVTDQNGGVLTNRVVTWSSSNPSVATVSSTGVVTAVAAGALVGTATITASAEGKSGNASVTVTVGPIASVRVTPTSTSVPIGAKVDLTAAAFDAAGNPISGVTFTWASSNPAIASVSNGEVNAKKEGTVTITAITSGTSGSATVTVTK